MANLKIGDIIRCKNPYAFEQSHKITRFTKYGIRTTCPVENDGFGTQFNLLELDCYDVDKTSLIMLKVKRKLCNIRWKLIHAGILRS